jgi:signal transduction histidine kinase
VRKRGCPALGRATLSHDLRNPLSAVKTNAQIIVRYPDQVERHRVLGNRIVHSVERADQMIQNLLDATRIRAGERLPLEIGECDLRQTVEDALTELSSALGDRFVLQASGPVIGFWSCDQVRRVIDNLVTNAVKYGAVGTPIRVGLREAKGEVLISVHNEGQPLTPEEQSSLFKPFSRTQTAMRSGKAGWGLGLTLVQGVAEAHGGKVEIESEAKKGTTFIVTLPRDARPYQATRSGSEPAASVPA